MQPSGALISPERDIGANKSQFFLYCKMDSSTSRTAEAVPVGLRAGCAPTLPNGHGCPCCSEDSHQAEHSIELPQLSKFAYLRNPTDVKGTLLPTMLYKPTQCWAANLYVSWTPPADSRDGYLCTSSHLPSQASGPRWSTCVPEKEVQCMTKKTQCTESMFSQWFILRERANRAPSQEFRGAGLSSTSTGAIWVRQAALILNMRKKGNNVSLPWRLRLF